MWAVYALCSAFFAALTSILAKVGIEGVNSNLATAVRTGVVLVMAWLVVFATGTADGLWSIGKKSSSYSQASLPERRGFFTSRRSR